MEADDSPEWENPEGQEKRDIQQRHEHHIRPVATKKLYLHFCTLFSI